MADNDVKAQLEAERQKRKQLAAAAGAGDIKYDTELYESGDKFAGYDQTIEADGDGDIPIPKGGRFGITAPREFIDELQETGGSEDPFREIQRARGIDRVIAERESDYHKQRHARQLGEEGQAGAGYAQTMRRMQLEAEQSELLAKINKAKEKEAEKRSSGSRWDQTPAHPAGAETPRKRSRWDQTPADVHGSGSETPRRSRWDQTPAHTATAETPKRTRSRWDETPAMVGLATPAATAAGLATPSAAQLALAKEPQSAAAAAAMDARNQYQTDEDLDALLPSEGYAVMEPPSSYVPIRTPARKLMATPAPLVQAEGFFMAEQASEHPELELPTEVPGVGALPFFKQEDMQFFGRLLEAQDEDSLDAGERRERQVLRLLLKIKNGAQPQRKSAMRAIGEQARELGADAVFSQVLPLLMAASLEDQERHLLVKALGRVLARLGELSRPFVHRILVVIEPMLIDSDRYARAEGHEIISSLSKAAGLPAMIAALRPDVDHTDEYVRNTTARALAVVAAALGVPALEPFLRAVCRSRRAWQARQTGMRAVRQVAVLSRSGVLPHLRALVTCVAAGLEDEHVPVRMDAARALAALAEAAAPYGIESFDAVLKPLWLGVRQHRGRVLAAFLKAVGFVVPLMDAEHASHYAREVTGVLVREFHAPDETMRGIVLRVVAQCVAAPGVTPQHVRDAVLPEFFRAFWVRRTALEPRQNRAVVDATAALAAKVGGADVLTRVAPHLKDEAPAFRAMSMDAVRRIVTELGALDVQGRLEELLIDGALYAFQEQAGDARTVLDGFGAIVSALDTRAQPYLQQITSALLWRLNSPVPLVRQQAADLAARIAPAMHACGEDELLARVGVVLYEYLGEEYPEVLAAILGALAAVVDVIGMRDMQPPVADLLPRLAPILRNRHERVQENCLRILGRVAARGAEHVSAREWMRSCFSLLDLLRAHKKAIRRAAVSTFGAIARAIGPQDVLATLLNNLKVQERQNRVCTTVAIAIVADTCAPFTVLPALMNEYRVPELNVQNGVLKALAFLFEYVGPAGRDYVAAVTPLLEDALTDRDLVHRQQAAAVIRHMALGAAGLGCEAPVLHLLNYLWPNIFETSPHSICAVLEAIESCRLCLGPARVLLYALQGLFHPARKVRDVYWRIYNMTYLAAQPAMVAFYPRIEDDANTYRRYELDYVL
ncbi:hypothetical protein IWW54_001800 [Coemansia sp. RSA 2705]|nr:hypothetical protein IWW54_001800 [Coemansia sp. RSA 2705]